MFVWIYSIIVIIIESQKGDTFKCAFSNNTSSFNFFFFFVYIYIFEEDRKTGSNFSTRTLLLKRHPPFFLKADESFRLSGWFEIAVLLLYRRRYFSILVTRGKFRGWWKKARRRAAKKQGWMEGERWSRSMKRFRRDELRMNCASSKKKGGWGKWRREKEAWKK